MSVVRHRRAEDESERERERQIPLKTTLTVKDIEASSPKKKSSSRGDGILCVLATWRERFFS